ncbi:MAG: ATP-binding protein [Myxococcota bacterium]
MSSAPFPQSEPQRLEALRSYEILDSRGSEAIDGLVEIASHICDTPIALVSLVDEDRQWFLSRVGMAATETHRDFAFCSHAILDAQVMQVKDALDDPRFADNPLVVGDPNIRFYAGTPLISIDGHALGTLCVIDRKPRALTQKQSDTLAQLGRAVTQLMELHRSHVRQAHITERVIQHDRLATTGTLAAGIGHEINNPLSFVMTNIDVALETLHTVVNPSTSGVMRDVVEGLSEAQGGVRRIRRIVRGLRSFAHAEPADAPCLVRPSIEISVRTTHHEIGRFATLNVDIADLPPVAIGESGLTQVLVNLLINAAQAFPTAHPATNRIAIRALLGDENTVMIEVEDNGTGITPPIKRQIFDPFFTTKPAGIGTGLRLAICHRVVDSAGGRLTCESSPGIGTTFRLRLPISGVPHTGDAHQPPPLGAESELRVIVIDDEQAIVRAVQRALSPTHFVEGHSDPSAALSRLLDVTQSYDAIVCDMMMPGLSGPELYRSVVRVRPEFQSRFVFISGGLGSAEVEDFLSQPDRRWLEKPFSTDELRQVIASATTRVPPPI